MKPYQKAIGQLFRSVLRKKYLFLILNGFLIASLLYFFIEDRYEKKLFEALANHVVNATTHDRDSLIVNSLNVTHSLGAQRVSVFGNEDLSSLKSSIIRPVTFDLMTTRGSCGSYCMVLSRVLTELRIGNRIVQMKVNGEYGGHIIVEVESANDGWVVLDPSYNVFFKKPDGHLATFADVQSNWDFYKSQVPAGYDSTYRYEGARYTNWDKIPVVMPMVKGILNVINGKEAADKLSLRTYFLRKFHWLFYCTLAMYFLILVSVVRKYVRRNKPAPIRLKTPAIATPKGSTASPAA